MRFSFSREGFLGALGRVERAVSTSNREAGRVRLTLSDGELELMASDGVVSAAPPQISRRSTPRNFCATMSWGGRSPWWAGHRALPGSGLRKNIGAPGCRQRLRRARPFR